MPIYSKVSLEEINKRKEFIRKAEKKKPEMQIRVIEFFERNRYVEYTPKEVIKNLGIIPDSVEAEAICSVLCDFRSNFYNKEGIIWLPAIDDKSERYYME